MKRTKAEFIEALTKLFYEFEDDNEFQDPNCLACEITIHTASKTREVYYWTGQRMIFDILTVVN